MKFFRVTRCPKSEVSELLLERTLLKDGKMEMNETLILTFGKVYCDFITTFHAQDGVAGS